MDQSMGCRVSSTETGGLKNDKNFSIVVQPVEQKITIKDFFSDPEPLIKHHVLDSHVLLDIRWVVRKISVTYLCP